MNDSPGRPSGLLSAPTTMHSLDQFRQTLNHYLAVIGQQQELLLSEYIVLQGQARLRLDQRQRLQRLLGQYQEQLLSFRGLLEQPQVLPDEVVPLRYLPLLFLQNAESQTRQLLDLLTAFPPAEQKRAPARQHQRLQQAFLQSWEQLLHYYEELVFHTRALSDQTRFLLRRLGLERRETAASQQDHGDHQPAAAQPDESPVTVRSDEQGVQPGPDADVEKR